MIKMRMKNRMRINKPLRPRAEAPRYGSTIALHQYLLTSVPQLSMLAPK